MSLWICTHRVSKLLFNSPFNCPIAVEIQSHSSRITSPSIRPNGGRKNPRFKEAWRRDVSSARHAMSSLITHLTFLEPPLLFTDLAFDKHASTTAVSVRASCQYGCSPGGGSTLCLLCKHTIMGPLCRSRRWDGREIRRAGEVVIRTVGLRTDGAARLTKLHSKTHLLFSFRMDVLLLEPSLSCIRRTVNRASSAVAMRAIVRTGHGIQPGGTIGTVERLVAGRRDGRNGRVDRRVSRTSRHQMVLLQSGRASDGLCVGGGGSGC